MSDTPTPMTDAWEHEQECNFDVPWEDNCRQLERELAAANERIRRLEEALEFGVGPTRANELLAKTHEEAKP